MPYELFQDFDFVSYDWQSYLMRDPALLLALASIGYVLLLGLSFHFGWDFACDSWLCVKRLAVLLFYFLRDRLFPPKDAPGPDSDGGAPDDEQGE